MRISEQPKLVTVFGASGFVGRHTVRALANRGYRIRAAVRRPDLAFHLQPLGNVGQIHAIQANLRYPSSVERAVDGSDAVVNLVGILAESGKQRFASVQENGARLVAEAAQQAGVPLVHVSAIGADPDSPSLYGATKGRAEQAVLQATREAVILRPSIVFGPEDDFFNRFASMATLSPFLPLIGGGGTRFQPVFVGDVAEAIALGVDGKLANRKIYELGGPEIATFRQCLELMMEVTRRRRPFISLPWWFANSMARLTQWMPGAPLTTDQIVMLKRDNVVSQAASKAGLTLKGIGIQPRSMDAILPTYLVRFRPQGQFSQKGAV